MPDDRLLFEFLPPEAAQAGLSWYTILRERENFRAAFDLFYPEKVARYDERKRKNRDTSPFNRRENWDIRKIGKYPYFP